MFVALLTALGTQAAPLKPILVIPPHDPEFATGGWVDLPGQKRPFFVDTFGDTTADVYEPLNNGSYRLQMRLSHSRMIVTPHPCKGCPSVFGVQEQRLLAYDFLSSSPKTPMYNITMPSPTDWLALPSPDGSYVAWSVLTTKGVAGSILIHDGKTGAHVRTITIKSCVKKNDDGCDATVDSLNNHFMLLLERADNYHDFTSVWNVVTGEVVHRHNTQEGWLFDGYVFYDKYYVDLVKNVTAQLMSYRVLDYQPEKHLLTGVTSEKGKEFLSRYNMTTHKWGSPLVYFNSTEQIGAVNDPYLLKTVRPSTYTLVNLDTRHEIQLDSKCDLSKMQVYTKIYQGPNNINQVSMFCTQSSGAKTNSQVFLYQF